MLKVEKVWENVPKPEKVWESLPKLEKVGESMLMCGKCGNGNCYLFAVQMLIFFWRPVQNYVAIF